MSALRIKDNDKMMSWTLWTAMVVGRSVPINIFELATAPSKSLRLSGNSSAAIRGGQ
jgi:hypothetical protein